MPDTLRQVAIRLGGEFHNGNMHVPSDILSAAAGASLLVRHALEPRRGGGEAGGVSAPARVASVALRHGQSPRFPDQCVVCARPRPVDVQRVAGSWCFGLRRAVVLVPMCGPCGARWSLQQRIRMWVEVLWLAGAALLALAVVPSLGPMTAEDGAFRFLLFAVCMLPLWASMVLRPLPFALRTGPEQVRFVFADAAIAAAFRLANADQAPDSPRPRRIRGWLWGALFATVAVALLSRQFPLPGLFGEHTGDALYATAAFFLLALVWPGLRCEPLAGFAFAFAAAVEATQLLHWPWLDAVRGTQLGALLLGQGFQVADLFAYLVGVVFACLVDVTVLRSAPSRAQRDSLQTSSPGPGA